MSDSPEVARPRLYLDVDGVIIAKASPFEAVRLPYFGGEYAPEVVSRLGATCLDLVWLTTQENEALELADRIDGLRDGRVLKLDNRQAGSQIARKLRALIGDQANSPSPFVWVDDLITPKARRVVTQQLSVPNLIVQTAGKTGLNEPQLVSIEQFARTHAK